MKKSLMVSSLFGLMHGIAYAQWSEGAHFGKTQVNIGNQDIVVQASRMSVPMVGIENHSDKPARCSATFSNGVQFSEKRATNIVPGKRAILTYNPVHYITSRVDIDVVCLERTTG